MRLYAIQLLFSNPTWGSTPKDQIQSLLRQNECNRWIRYGEGQDQRGQQRMGDTVSSEEVSVVSSSKPDHKKRSTLLGASLAAFEWSNYLAGAVANLVKFHQHRMAVSLQKVSDRC